MTEPVVLVPIGGDATLECQASGVPPPLVHWFKGESVNVLKKSVNIKCEGVLPRSPHFCFCFQVNSSWALLLLSNRTHTGGRWRSEGCRRLTPANITVWQAVLLEPSLAPSVWRLVVRQRFAIPHKAYFSLKLTQRNNKKNPSCDAYANLQQPHCFWRSPLTWRLT